MYEVEQTEQFEAWLGKLRHRKAAARIAATIQRLGMGLMADWKAVGKSAWFMVLVTASTSRFKVQR
jgi:putative addiction module killer protein